MGKKVSIPDVNISDGSDIVRYPDTNLQDAADRSAATQLALENTGHANDNVSSESASDAEYTGTAPEPAGIIGCRCGSPSSQYTLKQNKASSHADHCCFNDNEGKGHGKLDKLIAKDADQLAPCLASDSAFADATVQLLLDRTALLRHQSSQKRKKYESPRVRPTYLLKKDQRQDTYLWHNSKQPDAHPVPLSTSNTMSADLNVPIKLTVIKDENLTMQTPAEWHEKVYKEKLMRAREAIMTDSHIQMLRRFFDAELDEDSIRPVSPDVLR